MGKGPEGRFKDKVVRELKTLPCTWFVKINQVAIRGTPDFFVCIQGAFVALELKKSKSEKATPIQLHNITSIIKSKGIAFVVCPENWAEIFTYLSDMAYKDMEFRPGEIN